MADSLQKKREFSLKQKIWPCFSTNYLLHNVLIHSPVIWKTILLKNDSTWHQNTQERKLCYMESTVQLVFMESSSHLSRQNVKVKRELLCFISQPQCSGLFQNCTCQESNRRPQLPPSNSLPSFLFLETLSSLIRPTPSCNTQALHEGSPSNKTRTSHLPQAPHKQNTRLLIIFHC